MTRPDHLFLADGDGCLYDTRNPAWMHNPPLRSRYRFHHTRIDNAHELKACLRAGSKTDLGGYPIYFLTASGDVLSYDGVRANLATEIANLTGDGLGRNLNRIVACDVNWEDDDMYCNWTGDKIASAYGDDE